MGDFGPRLGDSGLSATTAHKLARILYNRMRFGLAYVQREESQYADEVKHRTERAFHRRAKELGYEVKKVEPAETPVEVT